MSAPQPILDLYCQEIDHAPLLDAAGERALGERIRAGDPQARNELVKANLRLVVWVAKGFRNQGLELADLISLGNIGLIHAAEKFDPNISRFSTYAVHYIKQPIRAAIAMDGQGIRRPVYLRSMAKKWHQVRAALSIKFSRKPKHREIREALGWTLRVYRSFVKNWPGGRVPWRTDFEPEVRNGSPQDWTDLEEAVRLLPHREHKVICSLYGLGGAPVLNGSELGRQMGMSRQMVSLIKKNAIILLREALACPQREVRTAS